MVLKLKKLQFLATRNNPVYFLANPEDIGYPVQMRAPSTCTTPDADDQVASLQSMCTAAVFMNHIHYWSLGPLQRNKLDYLAYNAACCDQCGRMASRGNLSEALKCA